MNLVRKFLKSEDGAIVAEYGLLLAMVAVVLIGVATLFGGQISAWYAKNTNAITSTGVP